MECQVGTSLPCPAPVREEKLFFDEIKFKLNFGTLGEWLLVRVSEAPWLAPLSMERSNRSMSGGDELVVL